MCFSLYPPHNSIVSSLGVLLPQQVRLRTESFEGDGSDRPRRAVEPPPSSAENGFHWRVLALKGPAGIRLGKRLAPLLFFRNGKRSIKVRVIRALSALPCIFKRLDKLGSGYAPGSAEASGL